jgi:tagaturonate epimerase
MMQLEKYSIGVGDRFGREGVAQMQAILAANRRGIEVTPVWNKSNREHTIVGTRPEDVRREADEAIKATGWKGAYRVDADHIGVKTVDRFVASADFFTLDVADYIGQPASDADLDAFQQSLSSFKGELAIPGIAKTFTVTDETIRAIGKKYCAAAKEAGTIYRHILAAKGAGTFIVEVSMDETDKPQTPLDLFFILAAIAAEKIPVQTVAPKFVGEFHKGVEYIGDPAVFAREFEEELHVVAFAVKTFNLPANLKLSVHSGSDKFSLYPLMRTALAKQNAGIHLKTAGTTWLEELIGLAAAGGDGLEIAKEIYAQAYARLDELCKPYATVVSIDHAKLPLPSVVAAWTSKEYVDALRHDQSCPSYNVNLRQMLHVAFRIAAELGERYLSALARHEKIVGANVTENILKRHLEPLFIGNTK